MNLYLAIYRSVTSNVNLKINNDLQNAQAAFDNSNIPITLKAHCARELDIPEYSTSNAVLNAFKTARGKTFYILNTSEAEET